jgi:hypothetical protein
MTDAEQKSSKGPRITEKQRYRYIGFEVFPGTPKDLFKSKAEQDKLVEEVKAKRAKGSFDMEGSTLVQERVSMGERLVMAVASAAMLLALLLPWYTVYSEVPATPAVATVPAAGEDSLAVLGEGQDSLAVVTEGDTAVVEQMVGEEAAPTGEIAEEDSAAVGEVPAAMAQEDPGVERHAGERSNEEILTGRTVRKSVNKEYQHLSGIGMFASFGNVGSAVFSSGFVLIITGILLLVYGLLCIGLPVLNFYALFGLKGSPDEKALKMKKYLRYNWLLILLLVGMIVISFIGASYGFPASESYTSLGDSYGIGVLLGTLSWGVFISMAASILVAAKGIEI